LRLESLPLTGRKNFAHIAKTTIKTNPTPATMAMSSNHWISFVPASGVGKEEPVVRYGSDCARIQIG
jgi:hypothetical protein